MDTFEYYQSGIIHEIFEPILNWEETKFKVLKNNPTTFYNKQNYLYLTFYSTINIIFWN